MARGSSKSAGGTGNRRGSAKSGDTPPDGITPDAEHGAAPHGAPKTGTDSPPVEQGDRDSATDTAKNSAPDAPGDRDTAEPAGADEQPADPSPDAPAAPLHDDTLMADIAAASAPDRADDTMDDTMDDTAAKPAPVQPPPPPARRGGVVPMVLGGMIAAGIGYGAAYMGYLPVPGALPQDSAPQDTVPDQSGAIADLNAQLAAMQSRIDTLGDTVASAPLVDLAPLNDQIAALVPRLDAAETAMTTLADRVTALEARPAFDGDLPPDTAAALDTAARLEAELAEERAAAQAQAADLAAQAETAAQAAAAAEAAAQDAIAQAEADTAAAVARATAEAALGQVQVALETGQPFADPLAALADVADVPEALAATADTGLPTLEALQTAYPALARAALPLALRETAGDGMGDRLGAFVMGQIGGRSVEPRAGDDPDAVLSRVEAALRAGDLQTALTEAAALPDGARAILAPWVADVEARAGAEAGLAALTAALSGTGN